MEALAAEQHGTGGVDGWLELGAAVSKFKRAVQSRQRVERPAEILSVLFSEEGCPARLEASAW